MDGWFHSKWMKLWVTTVEDNSPVQIEHFYETDFFPIASSKKHPLVSPTPIVDVCVMMC